ncbi:MAG: hypothetical protein ACI9VS_000707 [Candidatus Binatia bacterium]|jgi:hypothetical protein
MGFYLRKSFRAGPIRFNLSKSGIGVSAGVRGARVGVGRRGTYVHGGRHGLYYRKQLSSGQATGGTGVEGEACATLFLVIVAACVGVYLLTLLILNPVILLVVVGIAVLVLFVCWSIRLRRRKAVAAYKQLIDSIFVTASEPPSTENLSDIKWQQEQLPAHHGCRKAIADIETDVYHALLDKILDDDFIADAEAATIVAAEKVFRISPAARLRTKKEIFAAAYVEAIQDREITDDELSKLGNLMAGLAIPEKEVQREIDIVREIVDTQALRLPFDPIPIEQLAAPTRKNEDAFYQCPAQVLSRRKSKDSPTGYEYSIRRDGMMILTDKRVFVVGGGTTNVRFSEICDVDVDIDEGVVEISKIGSGRPIVLKTAAPIYTGRAIDLLVQTQTTRNSS